MISSILACSHESSPIRAGNTTNTLIIYTILTRPTTTSCHVSVISSILACSHQSFPIRAGNATNILIIHTILTEHITTSWHVSVISSILACSHESFPIKPGNVTNTHKKIIHIFLTRQTHHHITPRVNDLINLGLLPRVVTHQSWKHH